MPRTSPLQLTPASRVWLPSTYSAVTPGDMLFMKGRRFPGAGAGALVHKSPEKRYHPDGRVIHRLLLKIDLPAPGARQPVAGIQWERGGPP